MGTMAGPWTGWLLLRSLEPLKAFARKRPPPNGERTGISAGMVRLSVGVEHFEDIIADVERALAVV